MAQADIKLIKGGTGDQPPPGKRPPQTEEEKRTKRFVRMGKGAGDFESDVCDLSSMARLASQVIEDFFMEEDWRTLPDYEKERREQVLFAVYHLQSMICAFRDRYFALLHGED